VIDSNELADARWFDCEEVAWMIAKHPRGLTAPAPVAIAYHIIRAWVEDGVEFG
jgi:NAD+ diphosphatase